MKNEETGRASSFVGLLIGWLSGTWLLKFLIGGLSAPFNVLFALLFLYSYGLSVRKEDCPQPTKAARVSTAIVEALVLLWACAGVAAFLMCMWFTDPEGMFLEALGKAVDWNPVVFWSFVGVGVLFGLYGGCRTIVAALKADAGDIVSSSNKHNT
jgi:hypothetical protein